MTKYSLKNICLGIGIGLIAASMLNINLTPKKLTIDEIRREAEQYNLIVINAQEMIKKQPDEEKSNSTAQVQQDNISKEQTVTFIIESGITSEGIAEMLIKSKLIDNKQGFVDRLRELKKESKVQIGSFVIPKGASLDKIISIITTPPK